MVTVEVAQHHINRGERARCTRCPVALAIKDVVSPVFSIEVTGASCYITNIEGYIITVALPSRVVQFVAAFDRPGWYGGGAYLKAILAPFNFEADIPDHVLRRNEGTVTHCSSSGNDYSHPIDDARKCKICTPPESGPSHGGTLPLNPS